MSTPLKNVSKVVNSRAINSNQIIIIHIIFLQRMQWSIAIEWCDFLFGESEVRDDYMM